ncbi:APC family permease [Altererythrobacter lutimaris]|uniref:APC family permease n=1 Tax=Altererythrobacter lutimaris TaxID=2743979 RepID=A0A850H8J0_9SPHN|nr:APC family permease [Altererythrobacter lutimaris]NVE95604.1 APC family permease [Altererythrobacter lutimaris]
MDETGKPPRVIGLTGAILINLNGAVGAGIFALPALLYAGAGSFAPYSILIFALFYACLIAIPAKLSTLFDQSGGPQLYAQHAFGNWTGFQLGWFHMCANMSSRAANLHVLAAYLAAIFPFFGGPVAKPVLLVTLVLFYLAIALVGMKQSIGALWIGSVLKLSPILILCAVGLTMNGIPTSVSLPEFSEFEAVALLIAYAFSGAGTAAITAGETKEPQRIIFRSIFTGLAVVAVFYALVMLSYIAIQPDTAEVDSPLAAAGAAVFGELGILIISVTAIFSVGTNLLNGFLIYPRIFYGMGCRGLLPRPFAYVSRRFETPWVAILVYCGIVAGLALSGTFVFLAMLTVAVEQIILLVITAALVLIWRRNDGGIADRMGWRWAFIIPVGVIMMLWLTAQASLESLLSTFGLLAIGMVLYLLSSKSAHEGEDIRIVS